MARKFKVGQLIRRKKESSLVPPRKIKRILINGYDAPYLSCEQCPRFLSSYDSRFYSKTPETAKL
jgi:hypothetical protein